MRISEIAQNPSTNPEIFLDMDGVLADFFARYSELAELPQGSSYRDIPPAKRDPTLQKMVGTDFFYTLPKFSTTDQLVSMVVKVFGKYSICSSPLRGDYENSEVQKTRWLRKNLSIQPARIVITPNKAKNAPARTKNGVRNILIDDRKDNIIAWEAAGGIGIKYQADEDSLDVVMNGLRRAMEIIRGEREHEPQELTPSIDRNLPVVTPDEPEARRINEDTYSNHEERILDFIDWCKDKLNIEQPLPKIKFQDEKEGPDQHHTGYYNDHKNILWVYTGNRNLIDILRTVAHELTHRKQAEQGRVSNDQSYPGSPIEQEADAMAGYLMKLYGKEYPEIIE